MPGWDFLLICRNGVSCSHRWLSSSNCQTSREKHETWKSYLEHGLEAKFRTARIQDLCYSAPMRWKVATSRQNDVLFPPLELARSSQPQHGGHGKHPTCGREPCAETRKICKARSADCSSPGRTTLFGDTLDNQLGLGSHTLYAAAGREAFMASTERVGSHTCQDYSLIARLCRQNFTSASSQVVPDGCKGR
ncbi:uncharacterized protein B0I36DRAFT_7609 [Microdochium trichocladiopsis]|uniref:Uncharacterized protein n=1 Tax=Microdochium trichocladiopsis TaxID=1682393 RepID=A0A9P8YH24_9PEZI|nr:uncharacterized protein B0I36DRAFT_7609 [Microdochium trichocladiopsis]KAH7040249.1 hypothetical protein B0I36DRAFT_7609 [Microdochium trichocladiopsis]